MESLEVMTAVLSRELDVAELMQLVADILMRQGLDYEEAAFEVLDELESCFQIATFGELH